MFPDDSLTIKLLVDDIWDENYKFIVGWLLLVDAPSMDEPTPTVVRLFMIIPKLDSIPKSDCGFPAEMTVPPLIIRYPFESIPSPSVQGRHLLLKFILLSRLQNHLLHWC